MKVIWNHPSQTSVDNIPVADIFYFNSEFYLRINTTQDSLLNREFCKDRIVAVALFSGKLEWFTNSTIVQKIENQTVKVG